MGAYASQPLNTQANSHNNSPRSLNRSYFNSQQASQLNTSPTPPTKASTSLHTNPLNHNIILHQQPQQNNTTEQQGIRLDSSIDSARLSTTDGNYSFENSSHTLSQSFQYYIFLFNFILK